MQEEGSSRDVRAPLILFRCITDKLQTQLSRNEDMQESATWSVPRPLLGVIYAQLGLGAALIAEKGNRGHGLIGQCTLLCTLNAE
jgi:hypothetical protein